VGSKLEDAQNEKPLCEMNAKPKHQNLPLETMNEGLSYVGRKSDV
jgi:hypothetical protein